MDRSLRGGTASVNGLEHQLMQAMSGFSDEHKARLKEFFSLATTLNAEKRTSDFGKLLACIIQQR